MLGYSRPFRGRRAGVETPKATPGPRTSSIPPGVVGWTRSAAASPQPAPRVVGDRAAWAAELATRSAVGAGDLPRQRRRSGTRLPAAVRLLQLLKMMKTLCICNAEDYFVGRKALTGRRVKDG